MTESVQQSNMTHSGYFIWIFISSCGVIAGNVKNLPHVIKYQTATPQRLQGMPLPNDVAAAHKKYPDVVQYSVSIAGKNHTLHLEKNKGFVGKSVAVTYNSDQGTQVSTSSNHEMCMVLGMDRLLSEKEERDTLTWIDKIPFSRSKKNVSRDFSDGVMVAEIVKHYFPRIVDIHNYIASCNTQQKLSNWNLLNKRVFSKLDFYVSEDMVEKIVSSTPNVILPMLLLLKEKIENKLAQATRTQHYSRRQENLFSDVEIQQAEAGIMAQLEKMKIPEPTQKPQQLMFSPEMCRLTLRQVMLDKELLVLELQDIMKSLQVKVNKLEELIQLKDKRIEHLTSLPEMFKTKLLLPG